ncbi:MAG: hypothetical protein COZ46_03225 [Verrucomicrobia bacterium CG_4_10_14_3_um_filter_43_23]|nr:MAG: hypothetical protein AUJ82_00650 [Verrucomicrobia bacterium CG1_02_43_26]PIP59219.1 MAG: hypothetical protein COX01_04285 [Verrucomicrobia bacterium CG22_combo_CG10-13_8_21_14_all_43_17]PIX58597.1 MAG: hypothetical protein COZ46_03225 [Verrucomicrobia bacterium CG_4_10_14_3_um_filter_43_23]PIY61049.1 MAG: hypothetical protein COY94_07545 [Verrucomicrobia bacterium CG_4_10_14_0_8_um_filter_43_34]PJA43890.1 MAG: hypothetical protein CO175_05915 [Verrucomicrobia bacterium CG_4_9_14_3_um_fi
MIESQRPFFRKLVVLLGLPFHDLTMEEALNACESSMKRADPEYFVTVNVDFTEKAFENPELREILFFAGTIFCDGMPLVWLSRLFGQPLRHRIAGSDLTPKLLELCSLLNKKIYFLGSDPKTLQELIKKLQVTLPDLRIAGHESPPYGEIDSWDNAQIITRIKAAQPDLLMVAFGCPKQELWIHRYYKETGVPLTLGVGASLDFIAGKQIRAPKWMQSCSLEWLWRLITDPARLTKRYLRDFLFFGRMTWYQFRLLKRKEHNAIPQAPIKVSEEGFAYLRWKGDLTQDLVYDLQWPESWDFPVLCDLSEVTAVDSAGLGRMAQLARYCRRHHVRYIFLQPSDQIKKFIKLFHLEAQLPYVNSPEELKSVLQ